MPSHADNDFAAREHEEAAVRLARRLAREERRRAERRRFKVTAVAMAVVGALLLAGGLSAAAGARDGRPGGSGSASAQEPAQAGSQAPVSAVPALETSSAGVTEEPLQGSEVQSRTTDVDAGPSSPEPKKTAAAVPAKTASRSSKKTSSKPQPGILIRKCSGSGCHSVAEISGARVDRASAIGAVAAMVDAGRVKLTSKERAAVIAALTGK